MNNYVFILKSYGAVTIAAPNRIAAHEIFEELYGELIPDIVDIQVW